MYSDAFCTVYNQFGWNYFPEAFGEQLLLWMQQNDVTIHTSMDLACGTGILCEVLHSHGIQSSGMDFSEGMIRIAREHCPEIPYDVADMITYCPDKTFDLVTCTGDALNHILDIDNVEKIFRNIYNYLAPGGYLIFDLLNEKEVSFDDPIDLDFSETVKAQFMITQDQQGIINLKTTVYENGTFKFEENIHEIVHDKDDICARLIRSGFELVQCEHHLADNSGIQATTWYVIARKK